MRKIRTVNAKSKYLNESREWVASPSIVLQGKGVARLGFRPGSKVELYGKAGFIVVKLLNQE